MKKFEIPEHYKSSVISKVKELRKASDPRKSNYAPTRLDFGKVEIYLARHFGFCFGVENAIEIAYKTINENQGKRIFLLSEMIHNPEVNQDLVSRGVKFLMDTRGNKLENWNDLTGDDVVIIPAFGTTVELEEELKKKNINPYRYNTTCPFVERVWNKSYQLGDNNFTILIHGKYYHEETRATASHSNTKAPSLIIRDLAEAQIVGDKILGKISDEDFLKTFEGKYSEGFDVTKHLERIGLVNQTTMLASETEEIHNYLKDIMVQKYGSDIKDHFADTRDTLCYATNDNQKATLELLNLDADLAIVAGGYNSSNTSHLVHLLEEKFKVYFINNSANLLSHNEISSYNSTFKSEQITTNYLPEKDKVKIILTSGASCPDSVLDQIIYKLLDIFHIEHDIEAAFSKI